MDTVETKPKKFSLIAFFIWFVASLFFLYEFFLRTFLGALAKQIIPDLHLTASSFAWLASIFYVAYGLMQVPVGLLADRFGVKKCMIFATFICGLSAFLFSQTDHYLFALLYRFMMGFGGAFAFLCLLILTISWFPKKYLGVMVGLGQFVGTMGALIAGGPLASIVTKMHLSWRLVFVYIGALGGVISVFTWIWVKEKQEHEHEYTTFVRQKLSLTDKLHQLITTKQAIYTALYSSFVFLSLAMLGAVWGTLFLQSYGWTQSQAAFTTSAGWLGFAVGCPLLGYISDYLMRRKGVMIFCALVGLIVISLVVYIPFSSIWIYHLGFFLIGLTGAGQSVGFATITEHVNEHVKSIALGLNSAFITLLAAITPLVVGWIMDSRAQLEQGAVHFSPQDFKLPFTVMPLLYFLALIVVLFFMQETYCRSKKQRRRILGKFKNKNT